MDLLLSSGKKERTETLAVGAPDGRRKKIQLPKRNFIEI
jgi:hypothetical protein